MWDLMEPARKCRLGCYAKLALELLTDCICCERVMLSLLDNASVHVAQDGELVYIEWEDKDGHASDLKKRVAGMLEKYADKDNAVRLKAPKKLAEAAACLKLIVLGDDDEAKKTWPSIYKKLKGKPLNPFQIAAVEAIITEGDKLDMQDSGSLMEYSLREVFKYGIPLKDCYFTGKKLELAKKMFTIRGWLR